jgi:phage tail sheath protein FI
MAFYLSPLVDVNEIDLTTTVPAVATSIAVAVLRNTYKGPELKQTLVTNEVELIDMFGKPTSTANCYRDILSAAGFLRWGNKLYCTRVMPASASFAGTKAVSGTGVDFTAYTTSNAYHLADFDSLDPDDFADQYSATGTDPFWLIAASRGGWGNNIRVAVADYNTYSAMLTGGYSTWTTYDAITDIDAKPESTKEFLIVVQVKDQGKTSFATKEYWNVSTDETKIDDEGTSLFAENKVNQESDYIRIAFNALAKNSTITCATSGWQTFGGGHDDNGGTLTDAEVIAGYALYENSEDIDVNIFIDSAKSNTVKQDIVSKCETRLDAIAVLDCPYATAVNNSGSEVTDMRAWRRGTGAYVSDNLNINTSYAAVYGNWLEIYDKYNATYRWIPASGHAAGIFAKTDDVADPWFAPAGFNRGGLSNIRKLAWNPTQGNRDILYMNGINPLVSFSGQGKVIWGQKTMLDKESAFNRINVRRLFIILEKAISTATKYFLFEPNDDLTRLLLVNMIDPFLRDVKARRGVYDYLVICDSTNNTPERIDRNELWCDIYIKPTRAAEFIVLNFVATKTGASFTEIAALRAG